MTKILPSNGTGYEYDDDFDDYDANRTSRKFSIPNLDQPEYVSGKSVPVIAKIAKPAANSRDVSDFHTSRSVATVQVAAGCDTQDFQINFQCQTDDIGSVQSWSQAPPYQTMMESATQSDIPFSDILRPDRGHLSQSAGKTLSVPNPNDPTLLIAFVKRTGRFMMEMLLEDAYDVDTRRSPERNTTDEPIFVSQESFGQHFLFSHCQIESVSVSVTSSFSTFLICHRVLHPSTTTTANSRVQGFISGWNMLSVFTPEFVLATFDAPSKAETIFSDARAVVAGHRDGSLGCWNCQDRCVPYVSGTPLNGLVAPEPSANFLVINPCFVSFASLADSRTRPIVDLMVLREPDEESSRGSFASMDESGDIFIWHIIHRTVSELWQEVDIAGAIPGSQFTLVQIRRIRLASSSPAVKVFADPADVGTFFVMYLHGELRRFHRDGTPSHPVLYDSSFQTGTHLSFCPSNDDLFLATTITGHVVLHDKNLRKPGWSWAPIDACRVLLASWLSDSPDSFVSSQGNGTTTVWNIEEGYSKPQMKTGRIDGDAGAEWTGISYAGSCLLHWKTKGTPVVAYLNSYYLR